MRPSLKTTSKILVFTFVALAALAFGGSLALAELHIEPGARAVVFGVGQDGLGVREGPGSSFPTIATLPEGAEVDVLSGPSWKGYVPWYHVGGYDASGDQGWSAGNYLQPKSDPPAAPNEGSERVTPSSRGGQRDQKSFLGLVTGYSVHGRTSSGAPTDWGVVAVDPGVIPIGSKLHIDGFDEVFVAADTGGAVKGNWIDVYFPNSGDAYGFGIQVRRVTIVEP
jgi:3D (Asp-Asp-Asp) domain-containing protein